MGSLQEAEAKAKWILLSVLYVKLGRLENIKVGGMV